MSTDVDDAAVNGEGVVHDLLVDPVAVHVRISGAGESQAECGGERDALHGELLDLGLENLGLEILGLEGTCSGWVAEKPNGKRCSRGRL